MATKKQTETAPGPVCIKKRYLNDQACKVLAARLSVEMREDREGREKWGGKWTAYVNTGSNHNPYFIPGPKPLHLVIPDNFDQAQAVIERLFHADEAAVIVANLTP